jgi:hypothetical protein
MADIPQVLATYDALVGVALGAGLTYGLGALNRRHQEAREDKTRWYEQRLHTYAEFSKKVTSEVVLGSPARSLAERKRVQEELEAVYSVVRLVGSEGVIAEGEHLLVATVDRLREPESDEASRRLHERLTSFEVAARKDLRHLEVTEPPHPHEHQLRGVSVYLKRPPDQRK